jgi:hypothetical protein
MNKKNLKNISIFKVMIDFCLICVCVCVCVLACVRAHVTLCGYEQACARVAHKVQSVIFSQ